MITLLGCGLFFLVTVIVVAYGAREIIEAMGRCSFILCSCSIPFFLITIIGLFRKIYAQAFALFHHCDVESVYINKLSLLIWIVLFVASIVTSVIHNNIHKKSDKEIKEE